MKAGRSAFAASLVWLLSAQTLDQAKRAFDAGDYADAARLFEKAYEASPRCDVLFYLGMTRYRLRQLDSAIMTFQGAVGCDPKLLAAHLALAEAYLEKGNDKEALRAYAGALEVQPNHADALRASSALYLRHEMTDPARVTLERLVAVAETDARARADLGAVYAAAGDLASAKTQFEQALRLDPQQSSALTGLGNIHLKQGKVDEAIRLLEQAARLSPKAYEPRFLLGSAYNSLGRFGEAIRELETAIRLGGEEPEVYYRLARAYGGAGRQQDRQRGLDRFLELKEQSKRHAEAKREAAKLVERALPLVKAGNIESAIPWIEKARELQPGDAPILFRLAGLYYDLQKYNAARARVEEAIELSPSEWLYHYLLGLVEKDSGAAERARSSFENALRLNPSAREAEKQLEGLKRR